MQQTRYLPFGCCRAGSSPNAITSHAYTSQRENMEIGLYYYNARYYAPTLARFLSADTLVPDPTNPQSFNRYSYVLNSPLILTDPTGHWYYEPSCDCLAATEEPYNEYPENLQILHRIKGRPWTLEEELYAITYSSFELGIEDRDVGTQAAIALCEIYTNCVWQETIEASSRGSADYVTGEVSFGLGPLPPWLGVNVGLTRDRYGNWYFSLGGNIGKSFPLFGAARIVGGSLLDTSFLSRSEDSLESFLTGYALNIGGGFLGGFSGTVSLASPMRVSGEFGIYSPQIGASLNKTWLVVDH